MRRGSSYFNERLFGIEFTHARMLLIKHTQTQTRVLLYTDIRLQDFRVRLFPYLMAKHIFKQTSFQGLHVKNEKRKGCLYEIE